ncbi:MAG: amidase [Brevirhabdus sp.]
MTQIIQTPAADLVQMVRERILSAEEVMAAFLDRIEAVNPGINAIVSLRERAELLEEARRADATPAAGALHGLPIAIKDLADTKGLRTTQGSPLYADHIPGKDSGMVARIRAAGAIIIGKTNTPEFGLGSHTFNPVHGVTRNPYLPDLTVGGSSGGAAAALATHMLPIADGSDMMGSLRNPAAYNNVYGFRPSWGLVPRDPEGDAYLHQISTDGPMGRSPRDVALLLSVQAGVEPRQPYPPRPVPDFTAHIGRSPGAFRVGWLGDWGGAFPYEDGIDALVETALGQMDQIGGKVDTLDAPYDRAKLWQAWQDLRSFAIAASLEPLYTNAATRPRLKEAAQWEIERGLRLGAMQVQEASALRSAWLRRALELFETYDLLALPTAQVFPFPVELTNPTEIAGRKMDSYHRWMEVMVPASLIGLPALSVPVGFDAQGRPMGMQLIGAPGQDLKVLQIGQAWHDLTRWPDRIPPML